jgi:RNase P subunit RPR2
MDQRIYHGDITPNDLARALFARFNRGNLRAQQLGSGEKVVVQVASVYGAQSGGQTALSINLQKVADGVAVQIGRQAWFGVAASLGSTALQALRNPLSLIGRLDDLAQDIENLQLTEQVWQTIQEAARAAGASFELSERLRRLVCDYCETPNSIDETACIACGAPLGSVQPTTCLHCGFILKARETICPNCKRPLILSN